jgi:chorismate--pyruvate lyase
MASLNLRIICRLFCNSAIVVMADAEKQRVRPQYRRTAVWHAHSAASGAGRLLKHWLEDRGSLTARLVARCQHFRVQKLSQQLAGSLADEFAALGLASRTRVHQREVILRCDGVPVIYGHTVVPLSATHQQWPLFSSLGERSLGSTLFSDPLGPAW